MNKARFCGIFGHKPAGPYPTRCLRCDEPLGVAPPVDSSTISEAEGVLLAALGEIKARGQDRGKTHHDACTHPGCIASRAIDKYWEIVLAPFQGVRREDSPPPGGDGDGT